MYELGRCNSRLIGKYAKGSTRTHTTIAARGWKISANFQDFQKIQNVQYIQ